MNEIHEVNPKLILGMTASVSQGQPNLLYSYPLKTCLREKKYTKQVQIIAEKIDDGVNADEKDAIALRYAIERRAAKEAAIKAYAEIHGLPFAPTPVTLVCCNDIEHAEQVFDWLRLYLGCDQFAGEFHP